MHFAAQYPFPIEETTEECAWKTGPGYLPAFCKTICSPHREERAKCVEMRRRGLETAVQTGRENIFLCHRGLICCAYPIMHNARCVGGLFMGRLRVRAESDASVPLPEMAKSGVKDIAQAKKAWTKTPMVTPESFQKTVECFTALIREHITHDYRTLEEKFAAAEQQSRIAVIVHGHKTNGPFSLPYPYAREKELVSLAAEGNRIQALKTLNEILAAIIFMDPSNLPVIKPRVIELVIVLSRAAAGTGLEQDDLLSINRACMEQVNASDSVEKICLYAAQALERYMDRAVASQSKLKNRSLQLALKYITAHIEEKLSLREVSKQAGISPFRLAHIFRETMQTTFVGYINKQRIDLARKLLVNSDLTATEIAYEAGFSDQSYFTKVFKGVTGMTPKEFQAGNRRLRTFFNSNEGALSRKNPAMAPTRLP